MMPQRERGCQGTRGSETRRRARAKMNRLGGDALELTLSRVVSECRFLPTVEVVGCR